MAKMANRARMTVTSTGTGNLTLGSAILGYATFANAGVVNGDTISYAIEDGANWEVGTGVYSSTGPTLSRNTVWGSSASGSTIAVTTAAQVFVTATAADLQAGMSATNLVERDSTGAIRLNDGSAAAPSLARNNDDCGIFFPAADQVGISTNGTQRAVFASTGLTLSSELAVASGGTGLTSLTAGRIPFGAGTSAFGSSANLFWDNANGRLGIGTTSPTAPLTVIGSISQSRTTGDNQAYRGFVNSTNNSYVRLENTTGSFDIVQSNAFASITVNNSNPLTVLTGGSERMRIDSSGNVGIGTSSISERLTVSGNISATGNIYGAGTLLNMTNASSFFPQLTIWNQAADANAGYFICQKSRAASGGGAAVAVNDYLGTFMFKGFDSSGNSQNAAMFTARATAVGASSVDAFTSIVSYGATGYTSFSTNGTERMRIDSVGSVGIGTTSLTGYGLRLSKTLTGAVTSYGISINSTTQSDVTTSAVYFQSAASTAAAAFTLGQINHFYAQQGTIGAGSTVTNQYGFFAENSLTGATNNYGFYSNIASGTGRWNFYANGTANNAFAGNSRFGGLTAPVATVDVTGSVAATTTILSTGATSGIGYATGAGGAVTQATSRTTGVTINKACGQITLVSAAGSTSWQSFTVTNNAVASTDTIIVNQDAGTDLYQIFITNVAAGSFQVTFATTGGITTEQPVFGFSIIKAVAA